MSALGDKPFWAKCSNPDCGHCWPVAYLPMTLVDFARIASRATICPKCATEGALVAKQDDGALQEPVQKPA